ncbi:hypothetical protein KOI40_03310 [Aestuariicella sp. G3-2]|uniref:hypothetical protein n=1 Tax=Pseudomaricurvus albidus TaxID=2842452 RepID=UPI001C0C2EBE|nr:hypothetical protein [Aestuariicella albida]MBU3068831.1 hypothetical protein [Aestuariicella albida]
MRKPTIITNVFLGMLALMVAVDLTLAIHHEHKYGPYEVTRIEVLSSSEQCVWNVNQYSVEYEVELVLDQQNKLIRSPYVGLYPMRVCAFGRYYPLYETLGIASLEKGEAYLGNNGEVFLNRTPYLFNGILLLVLCTAMGAIFRFNRHRQADAAKCAEP